MRSIGFPEILLKKYNSTAIQLNIELFNRLLRKKDGQGKKM